MAAWRPYLPKVEATPWPTDYSPRSTEAPGSSERLSASAARRLRRRRAQERTRGTVEPMGPTAVGLEALRTELRRSGVEGLRGRVWQLSRDPEGCRLVQEALELGTRGVVELAKELEGHVLDAVMCPHANYVVQKVVSHLSVAASSFVAFELMGHAVKVAKHRFGCRIFCRLLEFCGTTSTRALVDELLGAEAEDLCSHGFAHHVVQSILEHGEERHKAMICGMLCSDLWRYACHKNSSYLIEKALCYCDADRIVRELGDPEALLSLALTPYGSFVARALLQEPRVDAAAGLARIRRGRGELEATKHGQRFLADVGLD